MSEPGESGTRRTVGVRDIPLALFAPRRLFKRVEDVGAYGWPLVLLLTGVTLIGWATVQTGLIDRQVDQRVNERIAGIDRLQRDVVERSALQELYQDARELGEFERLLTRIQVVVAEPMRALASILLISAVLYGAVALTGRKPEWHTLLSICVFASFVDLLGLLMRLVLMLRYATLEIDTSLALLTRPLVRAEGADPVGLAALAGGLTALEPFRVWFWLVVIVGLSATAQLRGWRAWAICLLCWLAAAGVRTLLTVGAVAGAAGVQV